MEAARRRGRVAGRLRKRFSEVVLAVVIRGLMDTDKLEELRLSGWQQVTFNVSEAIRKAPVESPETPEG